MNYFTCLKKSFIVASLFTALACYAEDATLVESPEEDAVENMTTLINEHWEGSYIDKIECQRAKSEESDIILRCESIFFWREEVLPPGQGKIKKYELGCDYLYKTVPNGTGFFRDYVECAM